MINPIPFLLCLKVHILKRRVPKETGGFFKSSSETVNTKDLPRERFGRDHAGKVNQQFYYISTRKVQILSYVRGIMPLFLYWETI